MKFEKFRPKALDEIRNIDIPDVVNKDIGEINLNDLPDFNIFDSIY